MKKRYYKGIVFFALVMVLCGAFKLHSNVNASGAGSAAKAGSYSTVSGAAVVSSSDSSKITYFARVTNNTTAKKYMSVNAKEYTKSGSLVKTTSNSGAKAAGAHLDTSTKSCNKDYTIKAYSSIHAGTVVGTPELESLSVTIN